MKVALIGEAEIGGDRRHQLAAAQAPLRLFEPEVKVVAVQRQPVVRLELPRELESAHRRHRRELGGGHVLIEVGVQVLSYPFEGRQMAERRR